MLLSCVRSLRTVCHLSVVAIGALSCSAQTANDLLAQADRLADQGNWYAAAPLYSKAEAEFGLTGDRASEIQAKLGRLHRDAEAGSYQSVRSQVVQTMADPVAQEKPHLKIKALALLGTIDLNLNTPAAFDDWTKLLAIATETGDQKWQNRAKGQLGLVAGVNGDIGAAAVALSQSIARADELGDVPAHVQFSIWLANGMAVNGMADRALTVLDKASAVARKNGYEQVPLQLSIARTRAFTNLPEPRRSQGIAEAKKLLAVTLAQAEASGVLGAQTELLNQTGVLALQERDFDTAEASFKRVAEIASAAVLPRIEAGAYAELSKLYRAKGEPTKANTAIEHSMDVLRSVEEDYRLPLFVAEKAEVQAALGDLKQADLLYANAMDLVEGLLVNATSSRVKSSMIGAMSSIYLGHFRLAWTQMHNAKEAFRIVESARGRALYDSIRYARRSPATAGQSSAERDIGRLQRRLINERLNTGETRRVLTQLDSAYDRLTPIEYAQTRKEMALLRRSPVSIETLQRQLREGEVLVEYVLDENASYVFRLDRSGIAIRQLASRKNISLLSKRFLTVLKSKAESKEASRALYDAIFAPVVDEHTTSLVVIPDGPLHLVPFSALTDVNSTVLASKFTVSTAPSATIYSTLRAMPLRTEMKRPFIGAVFTSASTSSASPTRGLFDLRGASFSPLQFGREEVLEAVQAIGIPPETQTIVDSEAALKRQPLSEFRVIHIAAHGVSNEEEPDRAALVLGAGGDGEDGLWQAREIRRSRLSADLVVLSACETGSGRLQGQEGVMNLARAFLTAGEKSVVASLWSVDDRSTATLMSFFYKHLAVGLSVSEALRQAQLNFIKDYGAKAHPYFWSGFEVIGDGTRRINFAANKADVRTTSSNLR